MKQLMQNKTSDFGFVFSFIGFGETKKDEDFCHYQYVIRQQSILAKTCLKAQYFRCHVV